MSRLISVRLPGDAARLLLELGGTRGYASAVIAEALYALSILEQRHERGEASAERARLAQILRP